MISYLIVFLFFLLLSAFFSSAETALTSINKNRVDYLSKKGLKKAIILKKLIENPSEFLSTILVGNTLVNAALASISTYLISSFLKNNDSAVLYSTIMVTIIILIFSEVTPKSFAVMYSEKLSFLYVYYIRFFKILFFPIIVVLNIISKIFLKKIKIKQEDGPHVDEATLNVWLKTKKIDLDSNKKEKLFLRFFSFFQKRVKDIMITRKDAVLIDMDSSNSRIIDIINRYRFSRYPVYKDKIDNIVGVLLSKDFIYDYYNNKGECRIKRILKKPIFIPESSLIDNALTLLRGKRSHIAMVVDEFGSFEGIITLEDIIEELTGEIEDEKDVKGEDIIIDKGNGWVISGDANIRDIIMEIPDFKIPTDRDYSTISGFILDRLGKIPDDKESFTYKGFYIKIIEIENNKIIKVLVEKKNEDIIDE
jgi:putative hemolysin